MFQSLRRWLPARVANTGRTRLTLQTLDDRIVPNAAPVVHAVSGTTLVGQPLDVAPLGTDADGDLLDFRIASDPAHGTVAVVDGVFRFVPKDDYAGTDQFTYFALDGQGGQSAPATVGVNVRQVLPDASDYDVYGHRGDVIVISPPLADPDGHGQFTIAEADGGGHAAATTDGTTITLTLDAGYLGDSVLKYQLVDQYGARAQGEITIHAVNRPPVGGTVAIAARPGAVVVIGPGFFTDPDGDPLTITAVGTPSAGSVALANGAIEFRPDGPTTGLRSFPYAVADGYGGTAVGAIQIDYYNHAPTAGAVQAAAPRGDGIYVAADVSDADGDWVTLIQVGTPAHGTLAFTASGMTYTPAAGYRGTDSWTYTVGDEYGATATGTATVTVQNTAPTVGSGTLKTAVGTAVGGSLVPGNARDDDGDALAFAIPAAPYHGSITLAADGSYVYTPVAGYAGVEAVAFTASDGHGGTAAATILFLVGDTSAVSGFAWDDQDGDGYDGDSEAAMGGVTVHLLKNGVPEGYATTTDDDGFFEFETVRDPNATYKVKFDAPEGYEFTAQPTASGNQLPSGVDPATGELVITPGGWGALGSLGAGVRATTLGRTWVVRAPEVTESDPDANGHTQTMTFTVKRVGTFAAPITIGYSTIDGTAKAGPWISDRNGGDYEAKAGTLTLPAGTNATATVSVTVYKDLSVENDEEFFLVLKIPGFDYLADGKTPDGKTEEGRRAPFGRGIIRNDDLPKTPEWGGSYQSWDDWEPYAVTPPNDTETNYQNGKWMRGWDDKFRPTYISPAGTPWVHGMIAEGDYLATKTVYGKTPNTTGTGKFRITIDWRIKDAGQAAIPMLASGQQRDKTAEHYGNGGVYIFNRYEVQIVDSKTAQDAEVTSQPGSPNTKLTPGWAYGVPVPPHPNPSAANATYNRAKAAGEWNTMVIDFTPPTVANNVVTAPARLDVSFSVAGTNGPVLLSAFGGVNGWDLMNGATMLKATGGKQDSVKINPLSSGLIFLQSHWGSQVEYRLPKIENL